MREKYFKKLPFLSFVVLSVCRSVTSFVFRLSAFFVRRPHTAVLRPYKSSPYKGEFIMLCTACGKNQATFYFKKSSDTYEWERHLCFDCAEKSGLLPFSSFPAPQNSSEKAQRGKIESPSTVTVHAASSCPCCGTTLAELLHVGKVGCAHCYAVFHTVLTPLLAKAYGGQTPPTPTITSFDFVSEKERQEQTFRESTLREWNTQMERAVEEQNYERAALYRDKIRALKDCPIEAERSGLS